MFEPDFKKDSNTFVSSAMPENFGTWQEIIRRLGDPNLVFVDKPRDGLGSYAGSIHYLLGNSKINNARFHRILKQVNDERYNGSFFGYDPNQVYGKTKPIDPVADYERAMKGI